MLLTVRDATFGGDVTHEVSLRFASAEVTVREIITERVTQEVAAYNESRQTEALAGLVRPVDAERHLNGPRKSPAPIDAERQVYVALDAFQRNGFFVLVDDVQAETLEQRVTLRDHTDVSFVRLTPLVGG